MSPSADKHNLFAKQDGGKRRSNEIVKIYSICDCIHSTLSTQYGSRGCVGNAVVSFSCFVFVFRFRVLFSCFVFCVRFCVSFSCFFPRRSFKKSFVAPSLSSPGCIIPVCLLVDCCVVTIFCFCFCGLAAHLLIFVFFVFSDTNTNTQHPIHSIQYIQTQIQQQQSNDFFWVLWPFGSSF